MQEHNAEVIIRKTDDGRKLVEIQTIQFSGKRKIDWNGVEKYLKKYIGESYVIDETDEVIFIGTDFPDEYAHSKDSAKTFGTVGKAKANASQAIPELIQTASNIKYKENKNIKHANNAKYGWYWCDVYFSLPKTDENRNIIGKNLFYGKMVIRWDGNEKLYLYDIIDIKKET